MNFVMNNISDHTYSLVHLSSCLKSALYLSRPVRIQYLHRVARIPSYCSCHLEEGFDLLESLGWWSRSFANNRHPFLLNNPPCDLQHEKTKHIWIIRKQTLKYLIREPFIFLHTHSLKKNLFALISNKPKHEDFIEAMMRNCITIIINIKKNIIRKIWALYVKALFLFVKGFLYVPVLPFVIFSPIASKGIHSSFLFFLLLRVILLCLPLSIKTRLH